MDRRILLLGLVVLIAPSSAFAGELFKNKDFEVAAVAQRRGQLTGAGLSWNTADGAEVLADRLRVAGIEPWAPGMRHGESRSLATPAAPMAAGNPAPAWSAPWYVTSSYQWFVSRYGPGLTHHPAAKRVVHSAHPRR